MRVTQLSKRFSEYVKSGYVLILTPDFCRACFTCLLKIRPRRRRRDSSWRNNARSKRAVRERRRLSATRSSASVGRRERLGKFFWCTPVTSCGFINMIFLALQSRWLLLCQSVLDCNRVGLALHVHITPYKPLWSLDICREVKVFPFPAVDGHNTDMQEACCFMLRCPNRQERNIYIKREIMSINHMEVPTGSKPDQGLCVPKQAREPCFWGASLEVDGRVTSTFVSTLIERRLYRSTSPDVPSLSLWFFGQRWIV